MIDPREGQGVYTARPLGRRTCACVARHVPVLHDDEAEGHHVWPLGEGGPDRAENMRWLCPITHTKVHNLWRAYQAHGGQPPPAVLRRYSSYVRDLVADGWAQAHPSTSPGE